MLTYLSLWHLVMTLPGDEYQFWFVCGQVRWPCFTASVICHTLSSAFSDHFKVIFQGSRLVVQDVMTNYDCTNWIYQYVTQFTWKERLCGSAALLFCLPNSPHHCQLLRAKRQSSRKLGVAATVPLLPCPSLSGNSSNVWCWEASRATQPHPHLVAWFAHHGKQTMSYWECVNMIILEVEPSTKGQ